MKQIPSDATVIRNDTNLLTAILPEVLIMIWRGDANEELLDKVEADIFKARRLMAGDYAVLVIIETDRIPPSPDVRKRLADLSKSRPSRSRANATVIQNEGFRASISRGVITEIDMVYKTPDRKVFDEISPATQWVADRLGHGREWSVKLANQVSSYKDIMRVN